MSSPARRRITIATRIFTPEPSAASIMLEAIAVALRDAGHEVTVLTTRPPKGIPVNDPPGIRVRRAPVLRDRMGYVRGYLPYLSFDIPLFLRLLLSRRADVYLLEPPPTTGAVVRVATAMLRRPYVYDAADLWSDAAAMATSNRLVLRMLRAVERFAIRGASLALAISEGLVTRMRELGIRTPTLPIGFGADAEFTFLPQDPEGSRTFVYAGSFSEWHGAGVFIEAFADFSSTHPDWRLVFVGNGSEKQALLARAAELGLSCVEFRNPVSPHELNPLLTTASASLASLKPGQGYDYAFTTKVYSSIAAGCPVLFSGAGPTFDFIADTSRERATGIAVPYEADAVAAAMRQFADNPMDSERRRSLSEWARARFSIRAIAQVAADATVGVAHRQV